MAPPTGRTNVLSALALIATFGAWPGIGHSTVLAQAQAPAPAARQIRLPPMYSASLRVRVVSDSSGRPVPGAVVTASVQIDGAVSGLVSFSDATMTTSGPTDLHGRASLRGLAKGRLRLSVWHPSFLRQIYGQEHADEEGTPIPIDEGEQKGEIEIRLKRGGVIGGSVLDEWGEPVVGVEVNVFRRQLVQGAEKFARFAVDETDDRGAYRVANLMPGQYIVGVVPRYIERDWSEQGLGYSGAELVVTMTADAGGSTQDDRMTGIEVTPGRFAVFSPWSPPPLIDANGRAIGHAPTFYPGTTTPSTATTVSIGPSEVRSGLDFRMHTATLSRLTGFVVDPAGGAPERTTVVLRPQAVDERIGEIDEARSIAGPTGEFGFSFVPVGAYTIEAQAVWKPPIEDASFETVSAFAAVTIGDEPVRDIAIPLGMGVPVSGRMQVESGASPASLAGFQVVLRSPGSRLLGAVTLTAMTDENGQFHFERVNIGRYTISMQEQRLSAQSVPRGQDYVMVSSPIGWHATAAYVDGRDVLDDAATISRATDDVLVTISSLRTQIRGTVRDSQGRSTSTGWVIVFPANNSEWHIARRVTATRPDTDGTFQIDTLPPGQYLIAIADAEPGRWRDPAFLDQLKNTAIAISLGPGEKITRDIRRR